MSESGTQGRAVVTRDVGLILLGVLVDRTVNNFAPTFTPVLPYAWLLVLVWLTREAIVKTSLQGRIFRAYSRSRGKYRMLFYGALFLVGGTLLCLYWLGLSKVLVSRAAPAQSNQSQATSPPASPLSNAPLALSSASPSPSPAPIATPVLVRRKSSEELKAAELQRRRKEALRILHSRDGK